MACAVEASCLRSLSAAFGRAAPPTARHSTLWPRVNLRPARGAGTRRVLDLKRGWAADGAGGERRAATTSEPHRIKPFDIHFYLANSRRVRQYERQIANHDPTLGPAPVVPGKTAMGVRIGGKLPPLNPTATQAVAPPVAPDYVNPRLGSTLLPNGQKQYTFRGQPVFDAYVHGGPKPQKSAGHERQKIGSDGSHVVEAKHNPASPVLRKKTQEVQMDPEDLQEVMADAEVGNDITQLLLRGDDETRRMAQHFSRSSC